VVRASVLAKDWGCTSEWVVKLFKRWCKERGIDPHVYLRTGYTVSATQVRPVRYYDIPSEAVEWIKRRVLSPRKFRSASIKEALRRKRGGIITIPVLAKEIGVSPVRLRREFFWWCWSVHGYDKDKVVEKYYRGGVGYVLPKEFVKYIIKNADKFRARMVVPQCLTSVPASRGKRLKENPQFHMGAQPSRGQ